MPFVRLTFPPDLCQSFTLSSLCSSISELSHADPLLYHHDKELFFYWFFLPIQSHKALSFYLVCWNSDVRKAGMGCPLKITISPVSALPLPFTSNTLVSEARQSSSYLMQSDLIIFSRAFIASDTPCLTESQLIVLPKIFFQDALLKYQGLL